jgi:DNA-binding PadR family transcriptional regulator
VLELAVLGLLKDSSMHGYELKKRLDEQLGHFWSISYGSLYPTLKRLASTGAIEISSPSGETSRRKNVYHITPHGEALFFRLLDAEGARYSDRDQFMLRFAFSRYMEPEARRRMLEGRRGYLQERLAKMSASLKRMRDRMDEYSRELMQYGVAETEHDIRWLNDMLAAEGVGTLPSRSQEKTTARRGRKRASLPVFDEETAPAGRAATPRRRAQTGTRSTFAPESGASPRARTVSRAEGGF